MSGGFTAEFIEHDADVEKYSPQSRISEVRHGYFFLVILERKSNCYRRFTGYCLVVITIVIVCYLFFWIPFNRGTSILRWVATIIFNWITTESKITEFVNVQIFTFFFFFLPGFPITKKAITKIENRPFNAPTGWKILPKKMLHLKIRTRFLVATLLQTGKKTHTHRIIMCTLYVHCKFCFLNKRNNYNSYILYELLKKCLPTCYNYKPTYMHYLLNFDGL